VLKAIESLEYVQVDPVRVVDTSHNLTLRNRVNDYRPELLAELLYTRRGAFEYWCSQRCILPMRDFPYFHYRMLHPDDFHSPFIESLKAMRVKFRANLEYVLSEIRKDGPLSASDLGRRGLISEKDAKRAMLMLWDSGEIMAHNVQGHGRIYDLTERLLPPSINMGNAVSLEEVRRFMLTKYFRSAGLGDTRDACRFGFWSMPAKERKMVSDELAHEGLVEEVRVEGVNATFYVPSDELQLLEGSIAAPLLAIPEIGIMMFGQTGGYLMMFMMMAAILLALNQATNGGGRSLYQMAEDGLLLKQFAAVNKHKVPSVAMLYDVLFNVVLMFLRSPIVILVASTVGYNVVQILGNRAFFFLRKKFPHTPRPFKVPKWMLVFLWPMFIVCILQLTAAPVFGGNIGTLVGVVVAICVILVYTYRRKVQDKPGYRIFGESLLPDYLKGTPDKNGKLNALTDKIGFISLLLFIYALVLLFAYIGTLGFG
jgi:hypothetical protein